VWNRAGLRARRKNIRASRFPYEELVIARDAGSISRDEEPDVAPREFLRISVFSANSLRNTSALRDKGMFN